MLKVHKIRLYPNLEQKVYFAKACGVARVAYNWALQEWEKQYKEGKKPSETALRKQLNAIKATEFPWMLEITKKKCPSTGHQESWLGI
jgi:putative transposase